ncbi:SDR family oxidoreductase [Thalassobacillus devorans]|uniref:SDR family oxidoreductase n=1 Tax=Thalassobacillus devorans TaxID=279813 RepID=UPI00048FA5AF|nr:SDR family oxidoreductase [Thalassobacillus devorans]
MANTYFFTGYPGFLASHLIDEIFHQGYPVDKIYLLYVKSAKKQAESSLQRLIQKSYLTEDKFCLIEGDITAPEFGIDEETSAQLKNEVTHFFHLAAIYDLSVPLTPAWQVNVNGTRHVNEWVKLADRIERYSYFSTAYVSGRRSGAIYENELEHEAGFKNHYEYTKYEAERLVQSVKHDVPTTILRPGIVVGDSKEGTTAKFDGPYFILNMIAHMSYAPLLPFFGEGQVEVNLVPWDYVVQAAIHLSHHPIGAGKTYHLTDPAPLTAKAIYKLFANSYLSKEPSFTVPLGWAGNTLKLAVVRKWLGMPKEALDYFTCDSHYDVSQTQKDLEGTPITCPDFTSIQENLVKYYKANRKNPAKQVSIH